MGDRLFDAVPEVLVAEPRDRLHRGDVAVHQRTAGQVELGARRVQRQIGHREVVLHPGAVPEPLGIQRPDGEDVRNVDLLHEGQDLVEQVLDLIQLRHVQRRLVVQVDRVRDAAHGQVLDVGRLRTEDRDNLVRFPLVLERLQVVIHGKQIHFRRQLHRRVAPVSVGEDPELSARYDPLELGLGRSHRLHAVVRPRRQALREAGGRHRVRLQGGGDIHPVERRQMVEVHDVIVHRVRDEDQVADVLGVHRNFEAERVLDRADRSDRVHRGTHPADPLREQPRVTRIPSLQDDLDSPPHLARRPGFLDRAAIHLHIDAEVSFDTGDRVYDDACHL